MQACTSEDMSDEAFPFRSAKEIDLGYARALCVRITYVGELGYELYIQSEMAMHAYDHVMEHGRPLGLINCGLKGKDYFLNRAVFCSIISILLCC